MEKPLRIQADLHTHTVASTHAYSTVTENCAYAATVGVKCIAMTDHAMMMPDAPHVWHFENLRVLPRKLSGVTVLKGAEANIIDYNGSLDLDDMELAKLEWVVASYHRYYFEDFATPDPMTVTNGYMRLLDNPHIDVIGHPTTKNFPTNWDKLVPAVKERGVLLELNESSVKYGKSAPETVAEMLRACKKYVCEIAVNTDSHFWSTIGGIPLAERIISEADFPRELIANVEWETLRERMLSKRPHLDL